jgi:energy-coupling factor transporter transmembrane protein EcfT
LALLIPAPAMLWNASTARQTLISIAHRLLVENYYPAIGFASLAIILIGLIVTWTGYVRGVRWTWFVMFLITWGWAFPVLVLAEFHWRNMMPIAQWPPPRPTGRGPQLGFTASALTFLLMVLALVVPVKTFVLSHRGTSRG